MKDNDLVGVAFIDTQIYIHQMLSIKSLILIADVYKSISLLRFQEEYRTLSLVSRVSRYIKFFKEVLINYIYIKLYNLCFYYRILDLQKYIQ